MQTTSILEASATVITITELQAGDVYKRVVEAGEPAIVFGIVQSVMHNGTDAAFTAIEISDSYYGVTAANKVFKAGMDIAIFAATPAEFELRTVEILAKAEAKINEAKKMLDTAIDAEATVRRLLSSARQYEITAPKTITGELGKPALLS